jgi:hypothetical protein
MQYLLDTNICEKYINPFTDYDLKNSLDTAREEGKIEVAKEMLKDNESIEKIIKYTGLTKQQIEKIKSNEG